MLAGMNSVNTNDCRELDVSCRCVLRSRMAAVVLWRSELAAISGNTSERPHCLVHLLSRCDNIVLQVRGLCGDMDGSHSGDFMSRAGIEEHLVAFAMSYSSCQNLMSSLVNYTQPQPCSLDHSVSCVCLE